MALVLGLTCVISYSNPSCLTTVVTLSSSGSRREMVPERSAGIICEVGRQPALDFIHGHSLACRVVFDLVAGDEIDGEEAGLRMREVKPADRGAGIHGKRLGQDNPGCLFHVEKTPQVALLGVVGGTRITRRR